VMCLGCIEGIFHNNKVSLSSTPATSIILHLNMYQVTLVLELWLLVTTTTKKPFA